MRRADEKLMWREGQDDPQHSCPVPGWVINAVTLERKERGLQETEHVGAGINFLSPISPQCSIFLWVPKLR